MHFYARNKPLMERSIGLLKKPGCRHGKSNTTIWLGNHPMETENKLDQVDGRRKVFAATSAGHAKSSGAGTVDLWAMIHLFRNNLGKIFFCVLLAVGAAAVYLSHVHPVYASTVMLEVAPDTNQNPANPPPDLDSSDILKTIELKIASQSVLLKVIKNNHLADDPNFTLTAAGGTFLSPEFVQWLRASALDFLKLIRADRFIDISALKPDSPKPGRSYSDAELVQKFMSKISVSLVRGSRLISVTVEDWDPKNAQHLAQAVIDQFFQESLDERGKDTASARELLLAEAKRISAELRASEEKLAAYRDKYNAVSLREQQNIVVERLRDLNQQVTAAQNTRLALEPDEEQVRRLADADPEQLLSIRSIASQPEVIDLRKQVALQEAQVATLAKRYGPLHPTMIQARSQLAELRSSLHASIRKAGNLIVQSYESARTTQTAMESALAEQEKASLELERIAIPYHTLEREVQANNGVYQKVLENLKQTDVSHRTASANDIDGVNIRVIADPLVPIQPVRPREKLWLALSVAAGLFLGCGSALFSHALDNTVSSIDHAESFLGLPVLTTVTRSRQSRAQAQPAVLKYPASAQAEAFRSLRTSLSLLPNDDERKFILFTSAVPGEGKSYCSLNTAAAFAQQGLQTLLIDGDLRRPGLQRLLVDWNEKPGLTDCLRQPDLFPEAVQATSIENLYCLGDRKCQAGGAELVGKDGLNDILQRARENFDRVIIDTAPLMAVSDTLYIAKNVPTVCLVIYAGNTPRRLVRRALKLLDDVAQRNATGVILNKVDRRQSTSHYYYYSGAARSA
jgi:succinoglycan biosynthesis transport protein ExoP